MRYYSIKPDIEVKVFGDTYICNHPVYDSGTLFEFEDVGLVIIQQYYDQNHKRTWWGPIENWIANDIYTHKDFKELIRKYAKQKCNNLYPTITVRHAMHWLGMKPLKKQVWETVFDRVDI